MTEPRPLPLNLRRINPERPETAKGKPPARPIPPAPDWLDDAAKAEWQRLAPSLAGEWRPQFEDSLAAYCCVWVEFKANPRSFGVPRIRELRALQAALCLTPKSAASLKR